MPLYQQWKATFEVMILYFAWVELLLLEMLPILKGVLQY